MIEFDDRFAERCANDQTGPVGLTLRQKLLPVEGPDAVVFPPTYAFSASHTGPPYNMDTLSDGTKVATIDSVGAQANRLEPLFKPAEGGDGRESARQAGAPGDDHVRRRGGIHSRRRAPLGRRAHPFHGAWDRREQGLSSISGHRRRILYRKTGAGHRSCSAPGIHVRRGRSCPRILQSVVRAWDIDPLTRSAQYNPPVDYAALEVFSEDEKKKVEAEAEKAGGKAKSPLAQRGFVHVPAPEQHGGILIHGEIRRDVTINLIALRRLHGDDGSLLRRYLLGLAVAAATAPLDGFLRQGCLITPDPASPAVWEAVERDGAREQVALDAKNAVAFAQQAAMKFGVAASRTVAFDKALAKSDAKKKA